MRRPTKFSAKREFRAQLAAILDLAEKDAFEPILEGLYDAVHRAWRESLNRDSITEELKLAELVARTAEALVAARAVR
ncbi:MAG: hypothetical protein MN733_09830 [Nitrososphaera sp.]|nr:hypothetical protein [Nitrososphaera sp.]